MYVTAKNSPKKKMGQKKKKTLHWPSVLGRPFICVPTALDNNGTNAWLEKKKYGSTKLATLFQDYNT